MSIQELEKAIQALPRTEAEALREWLDDYLEDQLELTEEFETKITRSEQEMAKGKGRVRNSPPR